MADNPLVMVLDEVRGKTIKLLTDLARESGLQARIDAMWGELGL